MKFFIPLLSLLATMALAQNNSAPSASNGNFLGSSPSQRYVVSQSQAMQILTAAAAESANISVPCCIAVVNPYSQLVAFLQTDNSVTVSIDISIKKAKTVTFFNGQFTTAQLYNQTQPGQPLYAIQETNGGLIVFGGGVPLYVNGHFIGAVGVSGGSTTQDVQIATAGVNAVGGYLASTGS